MVKRFVERESFKHKYAKELLHSWLLEGFDDYQCEESKVEYALRSTESQVKPTKVADVATFVGGNLHAIFEVYHTHRIEKKKLDALATRYPALIVYEVCADSVLNLLEKPSTILDLCEQMNGTPKKKKPRKPTRSYMYSVSYEESVDPRYAVL